LARPTESAGHENLGCNSDVFAQLSDLCRKTKNKLKI